MLVNETTHYRPPIPVFQGAPPKSVPRTSLRSIGLSGLQNIKGPSVLFFLFFFFLGSKKGMQKKAPLGSTALDPTTRAVVEEWKPRICETGTRLPKTRRAPQKKEGILSKVSQKWVWRNPFLLPPSLGQVPAKTREKTSNIFF